KSALGGRGARLASRLEGGIASRPQAGTHPKYRRGLVFDCWIQTWSEMPQRNGEEPQAPSERTLALGERQRLPIERLRRLQKLRPLRVGGRVARGRTPASGAARRGQAGALWG